MSYDPEARRDTPLARKLAKRIARDGPISVDDYMRACLYDPDHGYYVRQPAIGAGGDFVTAPEVSQVFGELIGLWCAVVWQQMGSPPRIRLTELGPGRGTLMADALRATCVLPAFHSAVEIELVEKNEVLIERQRQTLTAARAPLVWSDRLSAPHGDLPWIVLANEFLDTIPVRQRVWNHGRWLERVVMLDADARLQFGTEPHIASPDKSRYPAARDGDIDERQDHAHVVLELARHARHGRFAALLVDYGHVASALGDTLQAVRRHRNEHPLTSPGEADLTCQVDFQKFSEQSRAAGIAVDGPVSQAQLLSALGITQRASRLMAANPRLAAEIEAGIARLLSPTGMGSRFKAVGLRSAILPALPGFQSS